MNQMQIEQAERAIDDAVLELATAAQKYNDLRAKVKDFERGVVSLPELLKEAEDSGD